MDLTLTKVKTPFFYTWKIPESQIQRLQNNSFNGFISSEQFYVLNLSNVKYFFEFYPNGRNENRGKSEIYFYLDPGKDRQIEARFKVFIDSGGGGDNNNSIKCNHVFESFERINCRKMKHLFNSEKKLIVNGFLVIKVEGTLKVKKDALENRIFDNGNLWEQKDGSKNFTIVVGGKEIQIALSFCYRLVHKNILASESIAFANFFDSLTPDSPCSNVVEITGYPHHIVETAIKFCYFRNFVVPLTFEDAILLLQFFDEYKIELLKKQFEEFLITQISITTVTRLGQCAIKCHAKQLQEKCDAFYYYNR
uniref:BTB domain-containing protein n=1 Tax=Panagrolaimus davidi TaxID=227884 RepID=A0A914QSS9_9BILA